MAKRKDNEVLLVIWVIIGQLVKWLQYRDYGNTVSSPPTDSHVDAICGHIWLSLSNNMSHDSFSINYFFQ